MKFTFKTKLVAIFITAVMLVTFVPVFFSFASEEGYEENPEFLTGENGNLAIGATIMTQYAPHSDPTNGWDYTLINDGSMNTLTISGQPYLANGGYHPSTGARNQWNQEIFRVNHSEWIGYDFGSPKAFDTVMVWPCQDEKLGRSIGMPNAFAVEVSYDGSVWNRVYETYEYPIPTTFEPVVIQFHEVNAQYVRFVGLSMNASAQSEFAMKICEFAVFDKNYVAEAESYCPNIAAGKPVTSTGFHNGQPSWGQGFINDGNRYNMAENSTDWGQFCGWHGTPNDPATEAWIAYDLLTEETFDKVILWPSTEKYKKVLPEGPASQGIHLPLTFTVQISDDGSVWEDVKTASEMPTEYAPVEVTFEAVTARYVRFYMTKTSGSSLKLSEIEVFNTAVTATKGGDKTVVKPGSNVALDGEVIFSNRTYAENWYPHKLNNGVTTEADGGVTTEIGDVHWMGYRFASPTAFSKVVLYSATSTSPDDDSWSGVPQSFIVQVSDDGLTWTDVTTHACDVPAQEGEAVTVSFDTVVARYVRIWTDDMYGKPSDNNGTRIQLGEMEVWCDSTLLSSGEDLFAPFYQVKENADTTKHDVRIVLVANVSQLAAIDAVTVTVTFDLVGGGTKTLTKKLDGTESGYSLYKSVTASGDVYTAADGYAIFGSVITGIPDGAYTSFSVTAVDGTGAELLNVRT